MDKKLEADFEQILSYNDVKFSDWMRRLHETESKYLGEKRTLLEVLTDFREEYGCWLHSKIDECMH